MSPSLLSWLAGGLLLLAAGLLTTLLPRHRARAEQTRVAWSSARAAIDSATISRDATATPDTPTGWRARFATGDVTDPLLTLIAGPPGVPAAGRRLHRPARRRHGRRDIRHRRRTAAARPGGHAQPTRRPTRERVLTTSARTLRPYRSNANPAPMTSSRNIAGLISSR
ncbi:DUF6403 family protein [Micromonospora endophytica]|uniref:Uncharacterized protein n=1 Tax=Micromonospora endophytica TaxID=515350 RepID=A0A2W2CPQ9_9ACTN|nr:DUF6403 family protein [Micromonospora endophytica]PZF99870.1 hypothetical protein C1I93_04475 [Micromonospora endophytica]RIW41992.1 hypothetical protein D3H59_24340 [Micromonospora endophytica]BCJ56838.1 hypothetical protein Jiend_02600 [Micromonospora endophytica]